MEKALRDPESKVRKAAADSRATIPSFRARIVPTLLNTLEDENLEVRGAAIIALGKLGKGSTEVEDRLRGFLTDPDPATRMKAAVALTFREQRTNPSSAFWWRDSETNDAITVNSVSMALSQLMPQSPDKVAEAIGEALAKNREPLLTNTLKFVRASRAQGDAVLLGLAKAYDKAPPKVRALVLTTVVDIDRNGDKALAMAATAFKDPDPNMRREGLRATTRFGAKLDTFKPALLAALSDPDPENRILAMQVVKGFSTRLPEAGSKILTIAKNDPDAGTRTAALASLGSSTTRPRKFSLFLRRTRPARTNARELRAFLRWESGSRAFQGSGASIRTLAQVGGGLQEQTAHNLGPSESRQDEL